MGNTESNERQLFIGVILQLLSKRRIKVKTSSIQSFFTFVQDHCPWFLQQGTVNLDILKKKLGKQLRAYCAQQGLEKIPTYTFPLWNMTVIMSGCESWTTKKARRRRIDIFKLWCWRRLLRVP